MSFRDKMKVAVSNAEVEILKELSRRSIYPESQMSICLYQCKPDFYFGSTKLCVFIDGPPHQKPRRIDRDNGVDELLRKRGFKVARFGYKGKLSKQRLHQIVDEIEGLLR